MTRLCSFLVLFLSLYPQGVSSFLVGSKARFVASPPPLQRGVLVSVRSSPLETLEESSLTESRRCLESSRRKTNPGLPVIFSTAVLCSLLMVGSPASSSAYEYTDYASDTVLAAVQSLMDAAGNSEQTFKSYENIADIITEGKGVGGTINYKGVQLGTFFCRVNCDFWQVSEIALVVGIHVLHNGSIDKDSKRARLDPYDITRRQLEPAASFPLLVH